MYNFKLGIKNHNLVSWPEKKKSYKNFKYIKLSKLKELTFADIKGYLSFYFIACNKYKWYLFVKFVHHVGEKFQRHDTKHICLLLNWQQWRPLFKPNGIIYCIHKEKTFKFHIVINSVHKWEKQKQNLSVNFIYTFVFVFIESLELKTPNTSLSDKTKPS